MRKKYFNLFCPEKARVGFIAEVIDITKNPLTIGLFHAIRIMGITEDLSNLIH